MRSIPLLLASAETAPAITLAIPARATVYLTTEQVSFRAYDLRSVIAAHEAQRATMPERSGVREPLRANRVWQASPEAIGCRRVDRQQTCSADQAAVVADSCIYGDEYPRDQFAFRLGVPFAARS